MARSATNTLNINRGTTYTINFQYQRNGVNTTLIGATVRFTIKSAEYDDNYTDTSAVVIKNITTGNSSGVAAIILAPVDTATIEPGNYFYDIKVEDSTSNIYKCLKGKVVLDGSPTNRYT